MSDNNLDLINIVKNCKVLLLDVEGTTTSISFVKKKLFPYAQENVKNFLDNNWDNVDIKEAVEALRKLAVEDQENNFDGVVSILGQEASKEEQIDSLVKNVEWQMSLDRKVGQLKLLQGLIWKQGYENGDLKGHVYDDVSVALEQWHSAEDKKIYIYSSGSVQAQKLLFEHTDAGDLLKFIDGHFDTAVGPKQDSASYKNIVKEIGCEPDSILFLTDIEKEAEAARAAGLCAALVSREGNAPLSPEAVDRFPVVHSLAELFATNKRKPQAQDEQPFKIPKIHEEENTAPTKMEGKIEPTEDTVMIEEPIVLETLKEIEDSSANKPSINIEPVVIENSDVKSVENPEETCDLPKNENPSSNDEILKVVTEIEELTDDKQDITEIIDDLVPVIEEPANSEDIEELTKVGDILEEECNEILTKVQNVTNLSTIQIKAFMDPISEEMETESNDITEKILDTELDLGMKHSANENSESAPKIGSSVQESTETDVKSGVDVDKVDKGNDTEILPEKDIPETVSNSAESKAEIMDNNLADTEIISIEKTVHLNGNKPEVAELVVNGNSNKDEEISNPTLAENTTNIAAEPKIVNEPNGKVDVPDIKIKSVNNEINSVVEQTDQAT